MTRYPYDATRQPPAPVIALRISAPGSNMGAQVVGLVDTGADLTVIPETVARLLGLPVVGRVRVSGVGETSRPAEVRAAQVETPTDTFLLEVIALGTEAIVGRDLLNRWRLILDGPRGEMVLDSSM